MITETIYAGRDNTFSLQFVRGGEIVNLFTIETYELHLTDGVSADKVFSDQSNFIIKDDGIVEITIGKQLTSDDTGVYIAYMVTFDPTNIDGVRWPNFRLKVN